MAEAVFYAVLVGVILGVYYDVTRFFRLVFNEKFVFDFIFCVVSALVFYCYLLIFTNGAVRTGCLLFVLLGLVLYLLTAGYVTKKLELSVAKKVRCRLKKLKNKLKSLQKVLHLPHRLYYNILKYKKSLKSKGDTDGKRKKQ